MSCFESTHPKAVSKSDYVFSKTYNLKVPILLKPINPLKGTSKPPLQGRFGGVK